MAKYPYIVNKDGIWYPAGSEVPAGDFSASESDNTVEQKAYTKTDINRMPIAELKALAAHMEIESSETMSGADLKRALIEKLVL